MSTLIERHLIVANVDNAEGTQTWWVDAESKEDAIAKFEAGEGEIYSNEVEVIKLGDPSHIGVTSLDDFGDAGQPATPDTIEALQVAIERSKESYSVLEKKAVLIKEEFMKAQEEKDDLQAEVERLKQENAELAASPLSEEALDILRSENKKLKTELDLLKPECTCSSKEMRFFRCCKAPAESLEDCYKRGFNDGLNEAPTGECWVRVIDEALVGAHLGVASIDDDYGTAKEKLNHLICWSIQVDKDLTSP